MDDHLVIQRGAEAKSAARYLSQLRPEQRQVIRLSVVEGMSHSEIADSTGIAIGTVKSHIFRGLAKVRERLAEAEAAIEASSVVSRERAEELLAFRAVEGLAGAEEEELSALLAEMPEFDDGGFEIAAAACHLALLGPEEPLPESVRRRLEREAAIFQGKVLPMTGRESAPLQVPQAPATARRAWGGWLAAAACLLLALVGWWPRLAAPPAVTETPQVAVQAPPAHDQAPDALELPWQATDDAAAAGAAGSVVWSSAQQTGAMRIRGLAANDPAISQYQLWIFDKGRDERYPVDGGVFDMPAGELEAMVPIDAKVAVGEAFLFAITVEKPGGVVVSDRERIVLLAQVQA